MRYLTRPWLDHALFGNFIFTNQIYRTLPSDIFKVKYQ